MSTNANMYVTVDDLMHGSYRTSRGLPQEGIALVCLEHGVQPLSAVYHHDHPIVGLAISLGCKCYFKVAEDGSVSKGPAL
jgi:hypothetical protein